MNTFARIATEYGPCVTCGGDGVIVEFRRFAGEYQAGEPIEIPCPDCGGVEDEPVAREPYTPSAEYLAWCAEADAARTTVTVGDPLLNARPA